MENDKKVVPICKKCVFKFDGWTGFYCSNPNSPITNFLEGVRECRKLNDAGQCELYSELKPKEAIKAPVGTITVDLTLNTEPFKKKMAELLAGL